MNAAERTIGNILTEQICYEIRAYQRPYSWKKENVEQLLEDVWEAWEDHHKAEHNEYFIGSLITIEREKNLRYEVVDGQQRLATLNLIFARLRDHISDEAAKAALGNRILPRNALTGEMATPRLLLRKKDQDFFRRHVLEAQPIPEQDRQGLDAPQQRIIENLEALDKFFEDKREQDLRLFADYILQKVYVVFVNTDSWQSAYRLFNVLNARGLPLSNADLIKNMLFELLDKKGRRNATAQKARRENALDERWLELEEELGIDRLELFLGHHRTSVTAQKARRSLHEEFQSIIRPEDAEPVEPVTFLESLVRSAKNYMRTIEHDFADPDTKRSLLALSRVEYDEWIPPLLAYLNRPVADLPESNYISLLEKITMQNWICRLGRTARLTVYFQLISAIKSGKSAAEVREIFRKNARNQEFMELLGGNLYNQPFAVAVLLRLEEASQDDSVTKSYSGRLTIEHILPQAMKDDYWKARFTEDQHSEWRHRLGNLALLSGSKNYKAQYYDFERKKKIYIDRHRKVSFDLTKEVCEAEDWTVEAIKARHKRLLELAEQTWRISLPRPRTTPLPLAVA